MPAQSSDTLQIDVSLNGGSVLGLIRASINTTNCFSADTFSLTFASEDIWFWSRVSSALIEVTAVIGSAGGTAYHTLITGMADTIHVDPIRKIVGVEGRDLSSSLIDSYRQQDFVNQTASEVVSTVARYHDLQPVVSATNGNIGRYYSDGYTKLSLGQFSRVRSDWDLVVQLARQNGFDIFVLGRTLYFQPASGVTLAPIPVSVQDLRSIRIERNLNIASNTTAKVLSWNSQNMAAYNSDKSDESLSANPEAAPNLPFLFSGSNYTYQQVTESAEQYAAELTRLGTVLTLEMPWDLMFTPRATCLLLDTESAFDATYRIDSIERQFCLTSGSRQLLHAVRI